MKPSLFPALLAVAALAFSSLTACSGEDPTVATRTTSDGQGGLGGSGGKGSGAGGNGAGGALAVTGGAAGSLGGGAGTGSAAGAFSETFPPVAALEEQCGKCVRDHCAAEVVACEATAGAGDCASTARCVRSSAESDVNCAVEACVEEAVALPFGGQVNDAWVCLAAECATACGVEIYYPCPHLSAFPTEPTRREALRRAAIVNAAPAIPIATKRGQFSSAVREAGRATKRVPVRRW